MSATIKPPTHDYEIDDYGEKIVDVMEQFSFSQKIKFHSKMFMLFLDGHQPEDFEDGNEAYMSLMNKLCDPTSPYMLTESMYGPAITKSITKDGQIIVHVQYFEDLSVKNETAETMEY